MCYLCVDYHKEGSIACYKIWSVKVTCIAKTSPNHILLAIRQNLLCRQFNNQNDPVFLLFLSNPLYFLLSCCSQTSGGTVSSLPHRAGVHPQHPQCRRSGPALRGRQALSPGQVLHGVASPAAWRHALARPGGVLPVAPHQPFAPHHLQASLRPHHWPCYKAGQAELQQGLWRPFVGPVQES